MAMCDLGCTQHYGCRLRMKGVNVSNSLRTTQTKNMRPSVSVPPSHWKNIVYDERPGGAKLPILKADGSPLRHKEYQETRHKVDAQIRRAHALSA